MASEQVKRRLAAILAADVAGYSRLMGVDEEGTVARLKTLRRELIDPKIKEHRGRIVRSTGDGALIDFPSVVDAVRCAVEVQQGMVQRNADVPKDRRIEFRVGINIGDIIVEGKDIYGDGVNVAARLEGLAEPGGICISRTVRNQVRDKLPYAFEDMGEHSVKNITRPVRVFRIEIGQEKSSKEGPRATSTPVLPLSDKPAIAVLPFTNLSGDPSEDYFSDGLTEDVIGELAGWRAFPVIARNSTFTYKDRAVDIKKVGQELGARYILEGSVRKMGPRVRVAAQLIDAASGHHLMAERYDRDLTDIFAMQDEIASSIVGAIEPELLRIERDRVAGAPPSTSAYDYYQRGLWHHYRHSKEDNRKAQGFFRGALAASPDYAQAVAALGIAVCNAAYLGWADDPERNYEEAYDLGQRAVALDHRDPTAHFCLGLASMWAQRHDLAVSEMQETIRLNPSYAAAYVILGQLSNYAGRPEETIGLAKKGIRLSPHDSRMFIWLPALAGAYYQLGRYEEAIDAGRRAWELNKNWPAGLRYVVAALAQLGRMDEAKAALVDVQRFNKSLSSVRKLLQRLFVNAQSLEALLAGLRKAGMPEE